MKKRSFLILILTVIASVSTMLSGLTAFGSNVNTVSTVPSSAISCTATASSNIFTTENSLFVSTETNQQELDVVSSLIYYKTDVYKLVQSGFYLMLLENGTPVENYNLSEEVTVSLSTGLPISLTAQLACVDDNYNVEIITATVTNGIIAFTATHFGKFYLLLDSTSTVAESEVFENSRIITASLQLGGGYVSEDNYISYLNATLPGLTAFNSFDSVVMGEDNYNLALETYNSLLRLYKKASIVKLGEFYNLNDYSKTENGTVAVNNLVKVAEAEINSAESASEVDIAVNYFKTQIETGTFSKGLSVVSTEENYITTVNAGEGNLVFSTDSLLKVTLVKNQILIKNTNVALLDNDSAVENGGVYKYLNITLTENGVLNYQTFSLLEIRIKLSSLDITLAENETIQIAKYIKNQTVELIPTTVDTETGELVFNVTSFGEYAVVRSGYALESRSEFISLFNKYGVPICLGLGLIILLVITISVSISNKKRKEKKELNEYKKSKRNASSKPTDDENAKNNRKR